MSSTPRELDALRKWRDRAKQAEAALAFQHQATAELEERLTAAEDHIAGLCKELDSRAPGWENEMPWYARASNQEKSDHRA